LCFWEQVKRHGWNDQTKRYDIVPGDTFFPGIDVGCGLSTWHDAIRASLYDLFQLDDRFKDGDTFVATYPHLPLRWRACHRGGAALKLPDETREMFPRGRFAERTHCCRQRHA
jgi:hypothetical protein